VVRNAGASIFLTSENEWYKAAYYDAVSMSYFDFPAGSNTVTTCSTPTATPNRANCGNAVAIGGQLTIRGSYTGSASPYGTFDQGGNVFEWNETITGSNREIRGGQFSTGPSDLGASTRYDISTGLEGAVGIRLAMIPEPSTGLLVVAGLLGLAGWRRARA
jgi:formylglycine-generating enzyme required for sulfatase activity